MQKFYLLILLLTFSMAASGEQRTQKDWIWIDKPIYSEQDGRYLYAATLNNNNQVFGVYCYERINSCIYLVDLNSTCDQGDDKKYPALLNTNLGAEKLFLTCGHEIENGNALYASDFDQIDGIVRKASHIGFAVPMKDDSFKVVRFSLMGSSKAIRRMQERAQRIFNNNGSSSRYLPDEERL